MNHMSINYIENSGKVSSGTLCAKTKRFHEKAEHLVIYLSNNNIINFVNR